MPTNVYDIYRSGMRGRERNGVALQTPLAVGMRTLKAAVMIRHHMELYVVAWKTTRRLLSHNMGREYPDNLSVMDVALKAIDLSKQFEYVTIHPFRRNASFVNIELNRAAVACIRSQHDDARRSLENARCRMRWMFLLHHMQKDIIIPYALMLEGAMRRRRLSGVRAGRRIKVYRAFDPPRFAAMKKKVVALGPKIARCSDAGFDEPIKDSVRALVDKAKIAMDAYDWPKALLHLSRAARKL